MHGTTQTPALPATGDADRMHLRDLRGTLAWLKARGELLETDKEVDPDLEVTGLQKLMDGGHPVLFNNVKGKPNHRVLTNLFGDITVINAMFGWASDKERTQKLARALSRPLPPQEIPQGEAPCQEVVITNPNDVADYLVPIRHTALESELTVGSGIRCVSGTTFDGGTDVGYNRMNFRWGNVGTFQISPGSHMWQVVSEAFRRKERVPLTFCFGVPPACTLLAGAAFDYVILPYGCDELGVAGAAQGFPIRVVKARTVDAWAIADSEIVLEGYVDPRDTRFETAEAEADKTQGKHHFHPEWAGYMGKAYKAPTFHVTAVTMRNPDAGKRLVYCLGAHTLDEHNIDTSIREAAMFELCNRLQPGVIQDVNIPYCMTDWGRRHHPGEEAQPPGRGLAAQFPLVALVHLAGHAAGDRGERGHRHLQHGRGDVVPHHAGQSAHRHPQSNARRARSDLHAGRAHDRGRSGMDRQQYPLRRRHGHRRHCALRLRAGFHAAGLSGRPGEAGGFLQQGPDRRGARAAQGLDRVAGEDGALTRRFVGGRQWPIHFRVHLEIMKSACLMSRWPIC